MGRSKIKICRKDVLAFFLCFSFIQVDAVLFTIGRIGYIVLMLVSSFYTIVTAYYKKKILKSRQFIIWIVLMLWMILCTLINSQPLIYPIYYVGSVAMWILINDIYIEEGSLRLLRITKKYLGFLIIITFIQQIIAPAIFGYTDAMNARNILASDNYLGYNYVSYISICFILDFADYKKTQRKTYFMLIICFFSIVLAWSVKSMLGIGIIVLYMLLVYRRKMAKLLNQKVLLILFILIFIGVVFLDVQDKYLDFFSKYFGKQATVSVRYYVWMQALDNIKKSPLFGYGIREGQRLQLQATWAGHARSSHNIVLELILEGGFIGLGIYLASVIVAVRDKRESFKGNSQFEYLFLLFIIFMFYVMELASGSVYYSFYYMPIILINNLDKIIAIKIKEPCCSYDKKESMYCDKL